MLCCAQGSTPCCSKRLDKGRRASRGTHAYHAALLSALPCSRRIVPGRAPGIGVVVYEVVQVEAGRNV